MSKNPNGGNSIKQLVQVLIVSAVAILLVGGALIGLLNSQVSKALAQENSEQAQVGSSEQVTQRYKLTLSSYNDTIDHLKYLESSVTDASFLPTMLQQIQTLAQTTHLKVTSIRPSSTQAPAKPAHAAGADSSSSSSSSASKAPPYDTINIALDVEGTYPQTAAFLYDLTRFPKIVAVTSASLHPDGSAGSGPQNPLGSPTIHSTLTVTAYLFHDSATPDTATTPAAGSPTSTTPTPANAAATSVVPAPSTSATFDGAAQRAVGGAKGIAGVEKARTEAGSAL